MESAVRVQRRRGQCEVGCQHIREDFMEEVRLLLAWMDDGKKGGVWRSKSVCISGQENTKLQ